MKKKVLMIAAVAMSVFMAFSFCACDAETAVNDYFDWVIGIVDGVTGTESGENSDSLQESSDGDNSSVSEDNPSDSDTDIVDTYYTDLKGVESDVKLDKRMTMVKGGMMNPGKLSSWGYHIAFKMHYEDPSLIPLVAEGHAKVFGMIAPLKYFDKVNTNNYEFINWKKALENDAVFFSGDSDDITQDSNGEYYTRFVCSNLSEGQFNKALVCVAGLEFADGSVWYAAMPAGENYRTMARSLAFGAGNILNKNAAGEISSSTEDLQYYRYIVNVSVDWANGELGRPTDTDKYSIEILSGTSMTLTIGESKQCIAVLSPTYESHYDMLPPIAYYSSNDNVFTVTLDGKVTGKGKGTSILCIYGGGDIKQVSVKVVS